MQKKIKYVFEKVTYWRAWYRCEFAHGVCTHQLEQTVCNKKYKNAGALLPVPKNRF